MAIAWGANPTRIGVPGVVVATVMGVTVTASVAAAAVHNIGDRSSSVTSKPSVVQAGSHPSQPREVFQAETRPYHESVK
jgi:hypothetical protein